MFSPYSHNRQFGESFIRHQDYHRLAEGYYTVEALMVLREKHGVELPICMAVHNILYESADPPGRAECPAAAGPAGGIRRLNMNKTSSVRRQYGQRMFYFGVPPAGRGGGGTSRQERDTHMKDSRNERLRAMFAGRGYYIAIALCLVAAGTIGYFALRERPVTVEQTDTPPVLDIQPVTPTQPVVKPAPVVIPDPVEEAEITEPAELLPQVVSPLDGTTVTVFSMTELLYDPTMADWRTHDGIDVQADEGAAVKTAAAGTVQSVTNDELMGTTVVIQHEGGYATQYSSLQENTPVAQGQTVAAGEVIGYVGSTSAAESRMGPHLHFSVSRDGAVIDPHDYVNGGE